nr:aconitase X [Candidatus Sigynarchaeota archaeon]
TSYLDFGKLGLILGSKIGQGVPLIEGLNKSSCSPENLRQLGASMGASGAIALYHVAHVTPEVTRGGRDVLGDLERVPRLDVDSLDVEAVLKSQVDFIEAGAPVDLVFFGCPHASVHELDTLLDAFRGNPVKSRVWIATARDIKSRITADKDRLAGIDQNVKIIADTCIVVCPVDMLLVKNVITNSGKAFFYLKNKKHLHVTYDTTERCIAAALEGSR